MITIQDTQLKNYFTKEYNEDISFLLLPKNKDTLKTAKEFILKAKDSNIKQIIKIGSLGPWRLIHNQIDCFLKESDIPYTNFNIALVHTHFPSIESRFFD